MLNCYKKWCPGSKLFFFSVWLVVNTLMSVKDGWILDLACLKNRFHWACVTDVLFKRWIMWRFSSFWPGCLYTLKYSHEHPLALTYRATELQWLSQHSELSMCICTCSIKYVHIQHIPLMKTNKKWQCLLTESFIVILWALERIWSLQMCLSIFALTSKRYWVWENK